MKAKIVIMAAFLSISIASSFCSFGNKNALILVEYEKSDIEALEDEVIRKINETGPRSELSRDVTGSDIDFDRAYRVYANSKLFGKRTDDANEIKMILQNGQYLWQVPVFVDNDTVLVDIYKNAEDDVKDNLQETAGQWQVGAMYLIRMRQNTLYQRSRRQHGLLRRAVKRWSTRRRLLVKTGRQGGRTYFQSISLQMFQGLPGTAPCLDLVAGSGYRHIMLLSATLA